MKSILVPVEAIETAETTLRLAALAAQRLGAVVEGVALRRPPIAALGWDPASVAIISSATLEDGREDEDAAALFASVMTSANLRTADTFERPAWRWNAAGAVGDEYLGAIGRAFDLTVVSRPGIGMAAASITTLESALFESGGPILIAPPQPVTAFGRRIVVAWNGSGETARTIAYADPFLRQADAVAIVADDGALKHVPAGEDIRRRLAERGIEAELILLPQGGIRSGTAILKAATEFGCDLLVKGAYTQSRLRQMIFGGATNQILAEATIPVFMAH